MLHFAAQPLLCLGCVLDQLMTFPPTCSIDAKLVVVVVVVVVFKWSAGSLTKNRRLSQILSWLLHCPKPTVRSQPTESV